MSELTTTPGSDDFTDNDTEPTAPRNIRDRLKQRRKENAEEAATGGRTLVVAIPGYNNELFVRFTYTADAWDRLKKIGQRAMKSRHPRKELHAAADTLVFAATDILVSEDGGMTLAPYNETGEPVAFDTELVGLMDLPACKTAREVVFNVFNNDLAVQAMSNKVSEWMQGESEDDDEDFSKS